MINAHVPASPRMLLRFGMILLLLSAFAGGPPAARAQDVSLDLSTMHDENIFDAYQAVPDLVTQAQLDASQEWDYDASSLTLSYNGSLLLFRDLSARNYHVHVLSLSSMFQFERDQDDDDEGENSDGEEDSSAAAAKPPPVAPVHSDSLDAFFLLGLTGASQFDKTEFALYDNSKLSAAVAWRQPAGPKASLWPSYALSYHSYPNIAGISNVENRASFLAGVVPGEGGWLSAAVAYGIKSYTTSSTYTYIVGGTPGQSGQAGHGKGGAGASVQRTRTVTLNSPAVRQLVCSVELRQRVADQVRFQAQLRYFGEPSTAARILPQQLNGGVDQEGMIGLFTSQNEIFDDHYGYSGGEGLLGVVFSLPLSIELGCTADLISKKYTIPAKDLNDSLVVANNREDHRLDVEVDLSKAFSVGGGRRLKPKSEIHFLRNETNAPYYEFDKTTFLVGVEYDF